MQQTRGISGELKLEILELILEVKELFVRQRFWKRILMSGWVWFLAIFAPLLIYGLAVSYLKHTKLTAEAPVTILEVRMRSSRMYNKPSSYAAVDYKLTLNDKEVVRTKILSYVGFYTEEELTRKYKAGSVMKVCYNPENIEDPQPVLVESNESCQ